MAISDVPEEVPVHQLNSVNSDSTEGHCQSGIAGWVILFVGVLSMTGVLVLALTDRTEAAVALGSTAAAVCTIGGSLFMHRR
ncbi:hypothetical protein GCM10010327_70410 [Streptomyces nitrosporeus]|nr:hypothetical protein GCM10010327_70410 [Streptomyces nitrosporeus]